MLASEGCLVFNQRAQLTKHKLARSTLKRMQRHLSQNSSDDDDADDDDDDDDNDDDVNSF